MFVCGNTVEQTQRVVPNAGVQNETSDRAQAIFRKYTVSPLEPSTCHFGILHLGESGRQVISVASACSASSACASPHSSPVPAPYLALGCQSEVRRVGYGQERPAAGLRLAGLCLCASYLGRRAGFLNRNLECVAQRMERVKLAKAELRFQVAEPLADLAPTHPVLIGLPCMDQVSVLRGVGDKRINKASDRRMDRHEPGHRSPSSRRCRKPGYLRPSSRSLWSACKWTPGGCQYRRRA